MTGLAAANPFIFNCPNATGETYHKFQTCQG
jgi:hypothetical protein